MAVTRPLIVTAIWYAGATDDFISHRNSVADAMTARPKEKAFPMKPY
jgi:hypothetical protein